MSVALAVVITGILYTTLSLSPLILFGGIGEIITEKSGVADLGIEGIMLMSAFVTLAFGVLSGNSWLGILAGVSIGVAMGAVYGYLSIGLYLDQIATGLSIYLFGLGLSYVLFTIFSRKYVGIPTFKVIGTIFIPGLSSIPIIGRVLFQQNIMVYIALALVPATAYFLKRTRLGLQIKAVGENPTAADTMGINVKMVRFIAVLMGTFFAGLAGAYFEIGYLQTFQFDIILGRGFVALVLVYLSNWNPYKILIAALVFEAVYATQTEIISLAGASLQMSSTLFNILPYVFVLILIPIMGRRARSPKYLLIPYKKS
jgi:general nucleoside transport system permease protein